MGYSYFISLFLGYILVRFLITEFVKKLMFKTSEKKVEVNPDQDRIEEVKAPNRPIFIDYSSLNISTETIELREKLVKDAYKLFRKKYLFSLLASLIYIVFAILINKYAVGENNYDEQVNFVTGIAAIYVLYYSGVFFMFRKQFRAIDNKIGYSLELPQITIIRTVFNWVFHPKYEQFITFFFLLGFAQVIFTSTESEDGGLLTFPLWSKTAFIFVALSHLGLIYLTKMKSQKVTNIKLLILRVFGDKKQTLMTFGRLSRYWKHFGSWFTIIDPSYIKRTNPMFSIKSFLTLVFIFLVSWVVPDLYSDSSPTDFHFTIYNFLLLGLGLGLYYLANRFNIVRSFAKDEHEIRAKIDKLVAKPRKSDLTFKNLPMFCHDNTWKVAVSEFIKTSNVILMDLRGFSKERKGCEYEVDLILDSIPSKNIVFLVDSVNDKDLVKQLIIDRWEYLSVNSPNLNEKNPEVKIFNSMDGKEYDIQTTIDLLIEAAIE